MYECVASKPFEFRIQCECSRYFSMCFVCLLLWTCYYFFVPFLYFYAMVHLFYSIRFFIYFFHRLAPSRLDSKADRETMTRTRVNHKHKHIHKLVALENILLLAVFVKINIFLCRKCTTDRLSAARLPCRVAIFFLHHYRVFEESIYLQS